MQKSIPQAYARPFWWTFAFLFVSTVFSFALPQVDSTTSPAVLVETQWKEIASLDKSKVGKAVEALVALNDKKLYALLGGISNGEVYLYEAHTQHSGLVLVGTETKQLDNEPALPIYSIYPAKTPVLDASGEQIFVKQSQLKKLETNRRIRTAIEPLMAYINSTSEDIEKRKAAYQAIGNKGDTKDISFLAELVTKEKDESARLAGVESLGLLKLQSPEPSMRLEAVHELKENTGSSTLSILQDRLGKDEAGKPVEPDPKVRAAIAEVIDSIESRNTLITTFQNLFTGLSLGSILILMALGLAVIYGLMGVINMAHGEFMMIGAYTTFIIQSLFLQFLPASFFDVFFVISLPLSFLVSGGIGYIIERLIISRLYSRPLESLLATWGISLIFIQAARSIFGDLTSVKTPELLSGGIEILPQLVLPYGRLFIIGFTISVILFVFYILNKTEFGLKVRAVTQNRNMSACLGIPTKKVDSLAFFLGTGIAGIAGWAITLIGNVVPNMGQSYIVDSFLVVVTGGVGKLLGTIWSGLGIGFMTKFLEPTFEAVYAKVIILGIIILFLQNKPTGLFPAKGRNED